MLARVGRPALAVFAALLAWTIFGVPGGAWTGHPVRADVGAPSISTDQPDYAPASTVWLSGLNWHPSETVQIAVEDSATQSWSYDTSATASDAGSFTTEFQLPDWYVASYTVTATGEFGDTATTSFTDTSPPKSAVTFPVKATYYNSSGFNSGCAAAGFCGTAARGNNAGNVFQVVLQIQKGTGVSATYWNGTTWQSTATTVTATISPAGGAVNVTWTYAMNATSLEEQKYSVTPAATEYDSGASGPTTAESGNGGVQFLIDKTTPTSSIACNGTTCSASPYAGAVAVTLSATDPTLGSTGVVGSGVASIKYTTDGTTTPDATHGTTYTGPFNVATTTTVKYASIDNAGNVESAQTQVITIAAALHSTSTSITCSPASVPVQATTTCTATVTDTSGSPTTPTGTVGSWASDGSGTFYTQGTNIASTTCTLASGSCQLDYMPAAGSEGAQHLTASYSGDTSHSSSGNGGSPYALTVTQRSTTTSVSCSPNNPAVGVTTVCTATVSDASAGTTLTPTGAVSGWASTGSGTFYAHATTNVSTTCTLISGTCQLDYVPSATGGQDITASYGGDTNHLGSDNSGSAATINVGTRTTTTSVSCSPSSVAVNAATTCTATVTDTAAGSASTPTGTVGNWATDKPSGGSFTGSPCTLSEVSTGVASCTVTFTPAPGKEGTQNISAGYGGDTTHSSSSNASSKFALTVTKRTTTTSVSCAPSSVAVNAATTCTATVTDGNTGTATTPTGTVGSWASDNAFGGSFSGDPCTLSEVSTGVASCSVSFTPALGQEGPQDITAVYGSDTDHFSSDNTGTPFALTVTKRSTTTSVGCAPSSVPVNAPTTCTATVTDNSTGPATTPTGTVGSWHTDTTSGGVFSAATCTLSQVSTGVASCTVTFTPAAGKEGTQNITAVYGNDDDHLGSDNGGSPFALTVSKRTTSTSVTCSPSSIAVNASTTCTATVTDTDSGTKTTPTGSVGSWAADPGTGTFYPTSCTLALVSTSVADCTVTFTPDLGTEGPQDITAAYPGDDDHGGSNDSGSPFALTVTQRTTGTSVTCAPSSVAVNAGTTCTATVTDSDAGTKTTPAGTVGSWASDTLADGSFSGLPCTLSEVSTGIASCSVTFTPAAGKEGTQHISAAYSGDTDHLGSDNTSNKFALTVTQRTTTTSVSCSPSSVAVNAPTTCTATVTDSDAGVATTPTGTVGSWASDTLADGSFTGTPCTLSEVSTGSANCTMTFTPAAGKEGTQHISAAYGGDTDHFGSDNTSNKFALTVTQRTTTTSVSCAPSSVPVNVSTTCTATVTDSDTGTATTPTGTVGSWASDTLADGSFTGTPCTLSKVSTGSASCTVTFTPAAGKEGTQHISAAYGGDTDHFGSDNTSSKFALTVTQRTTTTSVSCAPSSVPVNVSTTCTATVTDTDAGTKTTPTGTVGSWASDDATGGTFGGAPCTLSEVSTGVASCPVTFTPAPGHEGTQKISAAYVGDIDHAVSDNGSSKFSLTVTQRTTTTSVSCAPSSVAVNAPTTCTATVTDSSTGTAITPAGTVGSWATDKPSGGSFTGAPCTLSPVSTGVAGCTVSFTPALTKEGAQNITAAYGGLGDHLGSDNSASPFGLTVTKRATTTAISCSPSPVDVLVATTCTATVSDSDVGTATTPTGSVSSWATNVVSGGSFSSTTCTLSAVSTGTASCSVTFTPAAGKQGSQTISASYGGDTDHKTSGNSFALAVTAPTAMFYNGQEYVTQGSSALLGAQLTSPNGGSACYAGKMVTFTLSPESGAVGGGGPYSVQTDSSGQATSPIPGSATSSWSGVFDVTASFAGTASCDASHDYGALTIAAPGDAADGGGWYKLPQTQGQGNGSPRVNFGFVVNSIPNTSPTQFKGELVLVNNGKWRLKGTLNSYGKSTSSTTGGLSCTTAAPCGSASGVGNLYVWNQALNGGLGDWQLVQTGVPYSVTFQAGSGGKNSATASFGAILNYAVQSGQPALPNSSPQPLQGGSLRVA